MCFNLSVQPEERLGLIETTGVECSYWGIDLFLSTHRNVCNVVFLVEGYGKKFWQLVCQLVCRLVCQVVVIKSKKITIFLPHIKECSFLESRNEQQKFT